MTTTVRSWLKKGTAALMATAMICNVGAFQALAAETSTESYTGRYTVPIASLTSAAPLPAVQKAFASAFGESVVMTVHEDGSQTVRIDNRHMVINLFGGKYDANVSSIVDANANTKEIEEAKVLSTKEEQYTPGMFASENKTITIPSQWEIPLHLDEKNTQKLSITVDFMDSFLGGGKPYPTTVTMTLDMDAAVVDTSELKALIQEYEKISGDNYTEKSYAALTAVIAKGKTVAEKPESLKAVHDMMEELKAAKAKLEHKGADYAAVEAALEKIPVDSSLYTESSWAAVEAAKGAVVNGLDITKQEQVDGFAAAIEAAVAALVWKDADYSQVDQAVASVPGDLSGYTDASVQRVKDALAAVVRGLKADRQKEVNQMAVAITQAVAALEKQGTNTVESPSVDVNKLQDGTYEISLALWHSTQDKASMAASSLNGTARMVVKDGQITMCIYTKPMTFGTITASLQELKVEQASGAWLQAAVESKSGDGNPTSFSFSLDQLREYVNVKVNPRVEMMGNQDLDARLKFDLSSVKLVSTTLVGKPMASTVQTQVPKTGDTASVGLWAGVLAVSLGGVACLVMLRRWGLTQS